MRRPPDLGGLRAIAVLRANAMGDYLVAEPALAALRAAAPRAAITLLGGDFAAAALPGRPGPVDEVVLMPHMTGLREPPDGQAPDQREAVAFFEQMRQREFDLAIQLHGGGRNSNPVVLALGAGFTAGLQAFDAPPLDCSISYQYWANEVLRYLEVVGALGAPPVRVHPHFVALESDIAASETVVPRAAEPLVVLHPGATDPRRRWPAAHFAQVADVLTGRGALVCLVGSAPEVGPVADASRDALALTDLTFSQLVGLLTRARLLVGNDSGPRHLADALGTPTVGVYWCGNMISTAPVGRAQHRCHVSWTTRCPECGISLVGEPFPDRCCDSVSIVSAVPVGSVLASALELYEQAHLRQGVGWESDGT